MFAFTNLNIKYRKNMKIGAMNDSFKMRFIHASQPIYPPALKNGTEEDINAKGENIMRIQSSISLLKKAILTIKKEYAAKSIIIPLVKIIPNIKEVGISFVPINQAMVVFTPYTAAPTPAPMAVPTTGVPLIVPAAAPPPTYAAKPSLLLTCWVWSLTFLKKS